MKNEKSFLIETFQMTSPECSSFPVTPRMKHRENLGQLQERHPAKKMPRLAFLIHKKNHKKKTWFAADYADTRIFPAQMRKGQEKSTRNPFPQINT
jgi:hypothetical protein